MKLGDSALTPQICFLDTKANIEAFPDAKEGMEAITTDTHEKGFYTGMAWTWLGTGGGVAGVDKNIQYNDGGSMAGDSNFMWDKVNRILTLIGSIYSGSGTINGGQAEDGSYPGLLFNGSDSFASDTAGGTVQIKGGDGGSVGNSPGGSSILVSGASFGSADAGTVNLIGGFAVDSGKGGNVTLQPGASANGSGGDLTLGFGVGVDSAHDGFIKIINQRLDKVAKLITNLWTGNWSYTLPNKSGTLSMLDDVSSAATTAETNAKTYADSLVVGLWDDRGNYNASTNAYPSSGGSGSAGAIKKGDIWTVSVAGTLPTSQVVEAGDTVRALVDGAGNTQANWAIAQNNIGYTAENSANKATVMAGNTTSNIIYLSAKAIYDWAVSTFQAAGTYLTPSNIEDSIVDGHTTIAPSGNAVYDALVLKADSSKGVTNGDGHDHNGGDGAQIAHGNLSSIGTNTHAQIDTHLAASNPHSGSQPLDSELTAIAGLTSAADKIPRFTGSGTADLLDVKAGTWTPSITNGTNVQASVAHVMNYIRVGNQVTFNGVVEVDTTAVGAFLLYLTLPIASDFTTGDDANGNGTQPGTGVPNIISIREDATNNRLQLDGYAQVATNIFYRLAGGYIIK